MMETVLTWKILLVVLSALLLRWCVALHSYSGQGIPPMFGDYEAQRHWMEVTVNLPISEWYKNSTDNDLLYWGLDYPPLTAYHSYLCGVLARWINPKFVELGTSRGYESVEHKLFMRYMVMCGDVLVYFPAVLWFIHASKKNAHASLVWCMVMMLYPGLLLIDHGHFQFNNISLGLTVGAVAFLIRRQDVVGSVFFCLALNYKQMELYHAMPFFFYLLGSCLNQPSRSGQLIKLAKIGSAVISTFILIWLPFLQDRDTFLQAIQRLFPFARGLFEDKVANFWCSISVIVKLKGQIALENLALVCLLSTLIALIPTCFSLISYPSIHTFLLSLVNSSLAFFLFSFQVHEKSILLAAIPALLLFPDFPLSSFWFLLITSFSMLPLLIKDGLLIPYLACTTIFYTVVTKACPSILDFDRWSHSPKPRSKLTASNDSAASRQKWIPRICKVLFCMSNVGSLILMLLIVVLPAPARYPDLYPLLVSVYSFIHFLGFAVYYNLAQLSYIEEKVKLT